MATSTILQRAVVVAVCGHAIGCGTVRIGAGAASSTTGEVSLQLTASIGATGPTGGIVASAGAGVSRSRTTITRALEYDRIVKLWPAGSYDDGDDPSVPRRMLQLGVRVGTREPYRGLGAATLIGAGLAYLFVVGGSPGGCVWFGLRDQTRKSIGIEAWLDGQGGGDQTLGHGMASIGVVYQVDWYTRGADCGS